MKIKKIVFYGKGNGRDHANHISAILSRDIEVYSIIQNENALMEREKNVIRVTNIEQTLQILKKIEPDLVVVSNRSDLDDNISNIFEIEGFNVFGISSNVAKLETSKEYAKKFMIKNKIRTPNYLVVNNKHEALKYVLSNWDKTEYGFVFKIDQFSKNSFERTAVPDNIEEAVKCINRLFDSTPNARLLIEEKIKGRELSLHILIKGKEYSILPMVQDYKKKYPNNEGPMTAGVASVACGEDYPEQLLQTLEKDIIKPTINGFINENITYNYILYVGIMITSSGIPYVLEYNTRTGNPEWLALLGLLNIPFSELLEKYYNEFESINLCWDNKNTSVAIYGLSSGYPETEREMFKEKIVFLEKVKQDTVMIGEHIIKKHDELYPNGGRVFALRRTGKDFEKIKKSLIQDFYKIRMDGLYFRSDITKIIL